MPTSRDWFPSPWLTGDDLAEMGPTTLRIQRVQAEKLKTRDGKEETKPVLYWTNPRVKPLVCNRTNYALLAEQLGDESDDWSGQNITLLPSREQAFGEMVNVVRVKPGLPKGQSAMPGVLDELSPESQLPPEDLANG